MSRFMEMDQAAPEHSWVANKWRVLTVDGICLFKQLNSIFTGVGNPPKISEATIGVTKTFFPNVGIYKEA